MTLKLSQIKLPERQMKFFIQFYIRTTFSSSFLVVEHTPAIYIYT